MDHSGDFLCEELLESPAARVGAVFVDGSVDGLLVQHGEDLDVSFGIFVADIEPELVEFVRRSPFRVEPYIALFSLSELGSVGFLDQGTGHCERIGLAEHPADELHAGGDVAPLVASAKLQAYALVLIKPEEVVTLEELVAEFGEGHALA